jgi:hypothetical protein
MEPRPTPAEPIRPWRFLALVGVAALAVGCQHPIILDSLSGRPKVYPDFIRDKPTILAFLDANDRRCDKEVLPLVSFFHRESTPVQIIGVMAYDEYAFVKEVKTLNQAVFPMLLDPDHRLIEKYDVDRYPTYVLLNIDGKEIDRVYDIREVRPWVDSPEWHEKELRLRKGTLQQIQNLQGTAAPASHTRRAAAQAAIY